MGCRIDGCGAETVDRFGFLSCVAIVCVTVTGAPTRSLAVLQTWKLDPAQTSLSITANVSGIFSTSPQVPGANVDAYAGTLALDRTQQGTNTVLAFSGGSAIDAVLNPVGPFAPPVGAGTGIEDNYGMKATVILTN